MPNENTLTREDFDEVIRRASELALNDPDAGQTQLDESDLYRIAAEVGLSEVHVRRALAELRGERQAGRGRGFFDGALVHAARTVPGNSRQVGRELDNFLVKGSLLRSIRTGPQLRTYKPANDTISDLKRALRQNKHCVVNAQGVEARIDPLDEGSTHVQLAVNFSASRIGYLTLAWFSGLATGSALSAGGVVLALASGLPVVLGAGLGAAAGGLAGWASVVGVRAIWRKRREEIHEEVEGILDKLEAGEPLHPQPAKWRRWLQDNLYVSLR